MAAITGSTSLSLAFKVKRTVVQTSLLALSTAFEIVSRHADDLQAEIENWEEGFTFSLGVLPDPEGPAVTLQKFGHEIRYLGKGYHNPQLKILFKNLDNAILPFTGQMGAHTAFIQHRAILHGNLAEAMKINRAMLTVQTYLMPGIIMNRIVKRKAKFTARMYLVKLILNLTLVPGLIKNARK